MAGQTTERRVARRTRPGEFTWVDLSATDLDAQTSFYEGLFGWTHRDIPTDRGPAYRMFELDGRTVAGAAPMDPRLQVSGAPSSWNAYLVAPSVDEMTRRAEELGARIAMPPMDVMSEGRMAGITDPSGATVFFWQPSEHGGAEVIGEPGTFMWADLNTRDPERAGDFYIDLLGWDIDRAEQSPTPYWIVSAHGLPQAGLLPMPGQISADVPSHWLVYFGVEDATAAAEKARSLGGRVETGPMNVGIMSFAVLSDPAGAVFAVMTPMIGV